MTTIHPMRLASLISSHRPFDLIDVRPEEQFNESHIPGARSTPTDKMSAPKILRERKRPASEPLFVIPEDRALAGMAAGILRGPGCILPVVVDGGMALWLAQDLPAVRTPRFQLWRSKE